MPLDGVGRDTPIVEHANGYKSSATPYRMDLMPGAALLHLANIMRYGAETHGENNRKSGSIEDHLNKALIHLFAFLDGDEQDDHLGHAAWRTMAALETRLQRDRQLAKPYCCAEHSIPAPCVK